MSGYTRLTVITETTRADVVVPDDEPVAGIIAELVTLIDTGPSASGRPVVLVGVTGAQLDGSATLADQEVGQGAVLRLTRIDQVPAPPEIADVTDIVADVLEVRHDRWRPAWTAAVSTAVTFLLGWIAASFAGSSIPVVISAASLTLVAALMGRSAKPPAPAIGGGAALGVIGSVAWLYPLLAHIPRFAITVFAMGMAATVIGVGARRRDIGLAGAVGGGLAGVWVGLSYLTVDLSVIQGAVAVLGVLLVGVLPGIAMSVSGLNRLDDENLAGRPTARGTATDVAASAHQLLTWTTAIVAVVTGVAAAGLLAHGPLAGALALASAAILASRARFAPLVPGKMGLILAVLVIGLNAMAGAAVGHSGWIIGLAIAGIIVAVALAIQPPNAHLLARSRRIVDGIELIAVAALLPLLLGDAGVFSDLIKAF